MNPIPRVLPAAALALAALSVSPATRSEAAALAFFVDPNWKTSSASVAVDANGGKHVTYYYYEAAGEQNPTHAVYSYCAAQCEKPDSWKSVSFAQGVFEVQLELTPQGKPRLMISAASTVYTGGKDYFYAACDGDCTQQSAWTLTRFFSGHVPAYHLENDEELPQHAFKLDPLGRPRFVVYDENQEPEPDHFGLFYLTCDNQCDDPSRWQETQVTAWGWSPQFYIERAYHPALAFTPDGKPRIASAEFFPIDGSEAQLAYLACDQDCDKTASWSKVLLMPHGGGAEPSVDIEVDSQGHPRLAFYQEALLDGQGKRLFYLACDDGCLDAAHWQSLDLGLGTLNGQEPDLELDSQGHPFIAYADWERGGLGLATCIQGCATSNANWQHQILEDRDRLFQAWPVDYPPQCDGGLWNTLTPALALSPSGEALIGFDADYYAQCLYDDDPTDNRPPDSSMHLIKRAVRVISSRQAGSTDGDLPQPTPGGNSQHDFGTGERLTIVGSGFSTRRGRVRVGLKPAKVLSWSDTAITIQLPGNLTAGTYPVTVIAKSGSVQVDPVTVRVPEVDGLAPSTAASGGILTLSGRYFGAAPRKARVQVMFGTQRKAVRVLGASTGSTLVIRLPRVKPGTYQVIVKTSAGTSRPSDLVVR